MRFSASTLVSVISLATLCSASAGAENFQGVLDDQGRPVPISLMLQPNALPGASAGTIRFDGSWACGFDLHLIEVTEPRRTYFFKGAGAGRCTVLTSGYLHSQPEEAGLAIRLFDQNNRAPALYRITVQPTAI